MLDTLQIIYGSVLKKNQAMKIGNSCKHVISNIEKKKEIQTAQLLFSHIPSPSFSERVLYTIPFPIISFPSLVYCGVIMLLTSLPLCLGGVCTVEKTV